MFIVIVQFNYRDVVPNELHFDISNAGLKISLNSELTYGGLDVIYRMEKQAQIVKSRSNKVN